MDEDSVDVISSEVLLLSALLRVSRVDDSVEDSVEDSVVVVASVLLLSLLVVGSDDVVDSSVDDETSKVVLLSLLEEDSVEVVLSTSVAEDEPVVSLVESSVLLSDDEVGSSRLDVLLCVSVISSEDVVVKSPIELVDDSLSVYNDSALLSTVDVEELDSLEVLGARVIDGLGEGLSVEETASSEDEDEEDSVPVEEFVDRVLDWASVEEAVLSVSRSLTASCTPGSATNTWGDGLK